MDSGTYALIGALGGAFIGFLSTAIVTYITKRYDSEKHIKELIIKTAIENWKLKNETAKASSRATGIPKRMMPLDAYIVHMLKFSDIILNKKLTTKNIAKKLEEVAEFSEKACNFYKEQK